MCAYICEGVIVCVFKCLPSFDHPPPPYAPSLHNVIACPGWNLH